MNPKLSVIIPIYNVENFLESCLDSVIGQSLREIEIVLVDDGSTDRSSQIAKTYAGRDPRIKYVRQENSGLGFARNTGVRSCSAEFFTFVDSDDVIHSDYCRLLVGSMEPGIDIASCMFQMISEDGKPLEIQSNFLPHVGEEYNGTPLTDAEKIIGLLSSSMSCARVYRKSYIEDSDIFFETRLPHEDWFFTYKAFFHARDTTYVEQPLYFWRKRQGSLSKSTTEKHVQSTFLLISDTEAFIERHSTTARFQALADSRSLSILTSMKTRCEKQEGDVKNCFWRSAMDNYSDIRRIFSRADRSIVTPGVYRRTINLIEELSRKRVLADFHSDPGFMNAHKAFTDSANDSSKIGTLRNAFSGKRCFIIGNGPSLNKNDLDLLRGEFTFGVNSFFLKTRDTGFLPTFYVVEDNKVMEDNLDDIRAFPSPFRFFPEDYRGLGLESEDTAFFPLDQQFYMKSKPYHNLPRFSAVAHDAVFAGQTVTYANLQLAFYLGFTEVYLIGMDFEYHLPPEHKVSGNHILSTTDDPNHFHKDYFGAGKTWKDPKLDRVLVNYRMADLAYSAVGRKIYNATVGGKLEIFDRVDYEALLRDPATGRKRDVPIPPPITARGSLARQHGHSGSDLPDIPVAAPPPPAVDIPPDLSARVLLDPATMLPQIEPGGALHAAAEAFIARGGPEAEHFARTRDWARRRVAA